MARGVRYCVTLRGRRRIGCFFSDDNYAAVLERMAPSCTPHQVAVRAHCSMPDLTDFGADAGTPHKP